MEISSIKIHKVEKEESRLRAVASMLIDGVFAVHNIKVIEGDDGLFISMPNRRAQSGKRYDTCHPINQETRDMIQSAILEEYAKIADTDKQNNYSDEDDFDLDEE